MREYRKIACGEALTKAKGGSKKPISARWRRSDMGWTAAVSLPFFLWWSAMDCTYLITTANQGCKPLPSVAARMRSWREDERRIRSPMPG